MKNFLLILLFTITSLQVSCQELVLQIPVAETNLCIALHNEIKASSPHVIQSYNHSRYSNIISESEVEDLDGLFYNCLTMYNNNYCNVLLPVSEDQLHSIILTMTRSAESAYQEVVVDDDLSKDTLWECLGILGKIPILTTLQNPYPCPEGYAMVEYDFDIRSVVDLMDVS